MAAQPTRFLLANVPKRGEACMSTPDMTSPRELSEALMGDFKSEKSAKLMASHLLFINKKLKTMFNIRGTDTYFLC